MSPRVTHLRAVPQDPLTGPAAIAARLAYVAMAVEDMRAERERLGSLACVVRERIEKDTSSDPVARDVAAVLERLLDRAELLDAAESVIAELVEIHTNAERVAAG